jgi:tetratricopeptide (TPR) repeat protein
MPVAPQDGFFARKARAAAPALIVVLACLVAYANAFWDGFVYDDISQILRNPWIRDWAYTGNIFSNNVWAFAGRTSNYYRPLYHFIYLVTNQVFGLQAWAFHLVNVVLHVAASLLVLAATRRLLDDEASPASPGLRRVPLVAALIFAVHPIHTEAVTYVAGAADLSFSLLCLLSFLLYLRSTRPLDPSAVLSALAFFLAALCKETALTLPVLLVFLDVTRARARGERLLSQRALLRWSPYVVAGSAYLVLRLRVLGAMTPVAGGIEQGPAWLAANALQLLGRYLAELVVPIGLDFYHIVHPAPSLLAPGVLLGLVGAVALIGLALEGFRRGNAALVAASLFIVLPLLPAFYVPALSHGLKNAFAERYLYLPSYGAALLAALALAWASDREPRLEVVTVVATGVLVCLLAAGTISRNTVWKDSYTLWLDTVAKSPDGDVPHGSLGYAMLERGEVDGAIAELRAALALNPDFAEAHNNLGIAYSQKGMLDEALQELTLAYRLDPSFGENFQEVMRRCLASPGRCPSAQR